jgi:uncharacterized protein
MRSDAATRAVIDTNAVLDWLVFGELAAVELARAISLGQVHWLVTPRMREELLAVLGRPLSDRWEGARKHALTTDATAIAIGCDAPMPDRTLVCRDPDDQMFVDLALAQAPAWLITRDRALLALRRRAAGHGVIVCTPTQWQAQRTSAVQ